MKHIQDNSFLLVLIAAFIFLALGSSLLASSLAETRSQVSSSVCNEDGTCRTTVCSDDQPCQSFPPNEPSSMSMRPVENSVVMEPVQETTIMEPVQNGLDEVVSNVEADPNSLYPASEEDPSSRYEDVGRVQGNDATETEEYTADAEYDEFEQKLSGTPEAVEVETESAGIEIFVDYVISDDGQLVVKNPNGDYNGGLLELQRGGTITFNFADCHTECDQPDAIRSVYLIDGDINDNMILEGNIDDRLKATFQPSDADSFQFSVPNGVTGPNTFNKLVIETQQTEENNAYYIQKGVEIS
ncbi:MAG: hypothetical protein WB815_02190 [Nitrososphaeraceae archaeon]